MKICSIDKSLIEGGFIMCGEKVQWKAGVAEVEEDLGKAIIGKYGFIHEQGKEPVKEEKNNVEIDQPEIISLKEEVEKLTTQLKGKTDECEELEAALGEGGKSVLEDEDLDILYGLATKTQKDLVSECNASGLPEEEWKDLDKLGLFKYIAKKAMNA